MYSQQTFCGFSAKASSSNHLRLDVLRCLTRQGGERDSSDLLGLRSLFNIWLLFVGTVNAHASCVPGLISFADHLFVLFHH